MPTQDEMWKFVEKYGEVSTKDLAERFGISWGRARHFLIEKEKDHLLGSRKKGGGRLDSKTTIFFVLPPR